MKLQMKDQLSFQEAMGYGDDPQPMTTDEVRSQIAVWRNAVSVLSENPGPFHDDLVQLESFLYELSYRGKVEYAEPRRQWEYSVQYDHFTDFKVLADTKDEADQKAISYWEEHRKELEARKSWENERLVGYWDGREIAGDDTPWKEK